MLWLWLGLGCGTGSGDLAPIGPVVREPPLALVRIWPGVRDVPVNGLRFRLAFTRPVELGPQKFQVRDAHDVLVPNAISKIVWNESLTEATVTPEGLKPTRLYRLHVEGLLDAEHEPIPPFDHDFVLRPPDEAAPSGAGLRIVGRPASGSKATLTATFPEPIDRDSLKALTVLNGADLAGGAWTLDPTETIATFTPWTEWGEAAVRVTVSAGVRDLGGNELTDRPQRMLVPVSN